jgi:AAA+ superfamily predicted ATPase
MTLPLCPAQQQALDGFLAARELGNLFVIRSQPGMGKTTVLQAAHQALGGAFLTMKEFIDAMRPQHPLALEETFEQWVGDSLRGHDRVFLDDLDLVSDVTTGCGTYPRAGFLRVPLSALAAQAVATGKKLIIACTSGPPSEIQERCFDSHIPHFTPEDYEVICQAYLGPRLAGQLDYAKIHRFAPHLSCHQLRWVSVCRAGDNRLDTDEFIEFLRTRHLISNVDLGEVQQVTLQDLKGVDAVIRSLEANVILPLENDELASELKLKPNRGVLLLGPPGTGKTTVGRALAHRLKSKFFLVDGTVISGSQNFYWHLHGIFHAARQNAPSIIFIDDSDVLFEGGEELGLYRYLLTMLDGLESESLGRVCVMMAAMDVSHLPPALIRSGRIELWLELHLPDEQAREAILRSCLARLPAPLRDSVDLAAVAAATDGLTGADLKRLVEDGKNALAYDRAQGRLERPLMEYLLAAVDNLRSDKERYTQAEVTARVQRPSRPVYYGFPVG